MSRTRTACSALLWLALLLCPSLFANTIHISQSPSADSFALVDRKAASLYVSGKDHAGVLRVAKDLQLDIQRVTGKQASLEVSDSPKGMPVIIGTLGLSPVIDQLAGANKINSANVQGRWETFAIQVVEAPLPGVERALVIFGSDKRGTIFGIYELSKLIGVSPWHFWADVPAQKKKTLHVETDFYSLGEPKVKYRGIFINDEAPALRNWAKDTYGDFNAEFYEKVYELILRNKANYLWPAMWVPSAFYVDDPESARLADELGVVIATTHHEPMMRAHAEWGHDNGAWNYNTNKKGLQDFWRGGIERMGEYESVVTVGMRGDGDESMSEDTAVDLLQEIIRDQRSIIEEVTQKPADQTPQVWALYKEVQDYYDQGMRVPDDILILLCDDNWGNVRFLPKPEDRDRSGGFGVYYHFDFVGGPVSYRWINVTQIERVWEQMKISYEWGADRLWLVNVGDIKPMELPTSFFLDFAWNPESIGAEDLPAYYESWAAQQFGNKHAVTIAEILAVTTKYAARRTPEMLTPTTYSLEYYAEAERVIKDYRALEARADEIYKKIPKSQRDAYFQLVLFPILVNRNLHEMYLAAAKNNSYALQGRSSTNEYAKLAHEHFTKDAELTRYFHEDLADGKWPHIMAQTHIGYTSWNNPRVNKMPAVNYIQASLYNDLGFDIHGMPGNSRSFPSIDSVNKQSVALDIFNTGDSEIPFEIKSDQNWITLSHTQGKLNGELQVTIEVSDWSAVPPGDSSVKVTLSGGGRNYGLDLPIKHYSLDAKGFVENRGVVSMEANQHSNLASTKSAEWIEVPNLGRTGSAMTLQQTTFDRLALDQAPSLDFQFSLLEAGQAKLHTFVSPTLDFRKQDGLHFAVSIDGEAPIVLNINAGENTPDWEYPSWWNDSVTDHIKIKLSEHGKLDAGQHTLKIWALDPGIVFQKFVVDTGGLKPSYLGPPQSLYIQP